MRAEPERFRRSATQLDERSTDATLFDWITDPCADLGCSQSFEVFAHLSVLGSAPSALQLGTGAGILQTYPVCWQFLRSWQCDLDFVQIPDQGQQHGRLNKLVAQDGDRQRLYYGSPRRGPTLPTSLRSMRTILQSGVFSSYSLLSRRVETKRVAMCGCKQSV